MVKVTLLKKSRHNKTLNCKLLFATYSYVLTLRINVDISDNFNIRIILISVMKRHVSVGNATFNCENRLVPDNELNILELNEIV